MKTETICIQLRNQIKNQNLLFFIWLHLLKTLECIRIIISVNKYSICEILIKENSLVKETLFGEKLNYWAAAARMLDEIRTEGKEGNDFRVNRKRINRRIGRFRRRKLTQVQRFLPLKIESQRIQRKQLVPCHFAVTRVLNSARATEPSCFSTGVVHARQSVKVFSQLSASKKCVPPMFVQHV